MSSGEGAAAGGAGAGSAAPATPARATADIESKEVWGDDNAAALEAELADLTVAQIRQRTAMLTNNLSVMQKDIRSLDQQIKTQEVLIKENEEKIKLNKQLPYLVGSVVELLDPSKEEEEERKAESAVSGGAGMAEDAPAAGAGALASSKAVVIKTTQRQTVYLPVAGLVPASDLKPGDLIGSNKDSFLILEKLPTEYDPRVKAMELDEKPTEDYSDIGGADKQIQELIEAVVLPMTHADRFKKLGIRPPKGVLLHGPPGTGKTLLARACAKSTDAVFLKLAGPSLVQMYIGDGAKMVRDAFDLARDKCKDRGGAIIFIDEIDAIGTKRGGGDGEGSREVQRTMLELLNQLDGFSSNDKVKVIAATNRPDTLDPALLRSGRLDRKIELPHPDEKSRMRIMQIHSRKMNVDMGDVNFEELARSTEDFNGAMLKAVCVEAGMIALRRDAPIIKHEDFVEGISAVQMKKKTEVNYYS